MGILETGLKAVVAVKAADVIHERILERQQAHAELHGHAPPEAAPAAAPQPAVARPQSDTDAKIEQLKQLGELKAAGVLTEEEFEQQKAAVLAS